MKLNINQEKLQQGAAGFGGYDPKKVTKLKDSDVKKSNNVALLIIQQQTGGWQHGVSTVEDTKIAWLIKHTISR